MAKSAFEISPARQNPKVGAMISMARGNDVSTTTAQAKSFEPKQVEDRHARDHRSDQDPRAIARIERNDRVRRSTGRRLIVVDDVCDDEEDDEIDAAHAPQAFPERGVVVTAGR